MKRSPCRAACVHAPAGSQGSHGPDRIAHNVYNAAGQVLKTQRAYGTSLQQDYVTYTYTQDLQLFARFTSASSGPGITNVYHAFGRLRSAANTMGGVSRVLGTDYNASNGDTQLNYPGGVSFLLRIPPMPAGYSA